MRVGGRVCSVAGCHRPSRRWGLCVLHSSRLSRRGSTDLPSRDAPEFVEAVRRHYEAGRTQGEVAEILGTTQKIVWRVMRSAGIPRRPQIKRNQRGSANSSWRPDSTNYATLHSRVEAARGKPQHCDSCGTDEDRRYHWANLTGDYTDVNDYARMCVPCHQRFDAERRQLTGRNTGLPR